MDVYILDRFMRRSRVVDVFESLVWAERWNEIGDFTLKLKGTNQNRGYFQPGARLAIDNSNYVMIVETVNDGIDEDGRLVLEVSGRSLEGLLDDRVVTEDLLTLETWAIQGTPGATMRMLFDHVCVQGNLDTADIIPLVVDSGSLIGAGFDSGDIPEYSTSILWELEPTTLYRALNDLASVYDLGFRLIRNGDHAQLYFDVYTGTDRTTNQTTIKPVIFSADMNNLNDGHELNNIKKSKNVAYVLSDSGTQVVYGEGVDPAIEGFERRVMVVKPTVDASITDVPGYLTEVGIRELRKNRPLSMFDGEVDQHDAYIYGVDYNLGDLVEVRNRDGVVSNKRVTEHIFVEDEAGERSYPTLSVGDFVGVNTWLAYGADDTAWADLTTEEWETS